MTDLIVFQGHIDGIQTRKDRSVKISLVTALEMTAAVELAKLFSLQDNVVTVAMKVGTITDEEVLALPEPKPEFSGEKSPAQRLRGALFRLWEQQGKKQEFELFYRRSYERLIDTVKEKLT